MKKKWMCVLLAALLLLPLTACSGQKSSSEEGTKPAAQEQKKEEVDLDLTSLSATMVYSEVFNMMQTPGDYDGKTIRMAGKAASYKDESTGKVYHACIVQDATACCAQGLEYQLAEGEGYPKDDTQITVVGVYRVIDQEGMDYGVLKKAKVT